MNLQFPPQKWLKNLGFNKSTPPVAEILFSLPTKVGSKMEIVFKKSAEKEILSFGKQLGQRIFQKIASLKDNPFGQGSKKMSGGNEYRIRIGNYRVIYQVDKKEKIITIIKLAHRREVYR